MQKPPFAKPDQPASGKLRLRESDGMPGRRAALAEGTLSKPMTGPQGDENRDPQPKPAKSGPRVA